MVQRTKKLCSIDGCNKTHHARGYCSKHYSAWHRAEGKHAALQFQAETPEDSFQHRTSPSGDCLIWAGTKNMAGYGRITVNKTKRQAHHYAWERVNGKIPVGFEVDHTCHNPSCVKIDHLRLADSSQNSSHRRGAQSNSSSGIRNVYKRGDKWTVIIGKAGKLHYFGQYDTPEEAEKVAIEMREKLFKEYSGASR